MLKFIELYIIAVNHQFLVPLLLVCQSFIQTSFPYKYKHALTNSVFLRKMSCDRLLFCTLLRFALDLHIATHLLAWILLQGDMDAT